ncbi:MAG: helix-turn-helix transcriptional regulator [Oscillospiraceae bacterium]|nr:helix-turn-helix transcriptional regulator [Oscillospiraceae bacterium]
MSEFQAYLQQALKKVEITKESKDDRIEDYDIFAEIAEMIIEARNEQGITQGQLAELTGVSQANISKFETGNSKPNILTLKKIADGLNKRLVIAFANGEEEE